jgi:hypothetical protein
MTKAETLAMEKENQDDDFQKDLTINKYKLDEECLSHSSRYAYYAEAQAVAKSNVSKAKDKLELVESESNLKIRKKFAEEGQKVTESVIACTLAMDSDVIQAKKELREAEEIFGRLSVAVSAMDARKSELDNLVKLYCAGYFSTPSANGAKNNINEMTENSIRKQLNNKE